MTIIDDVFYWIPFVIWIMILVMIVVLYRKT